MNGRVVHPADPEWPPGLNELAVHQPPKELFVAGRALDAGPTTVAVVGTRRPTATGVDVARRISTGLAEAGYVVVSGLAVGIDAVAHRAALDAGGYTIAVLGCGLDVCYPARNARLREQVRERGTLVSEYPPGTMPWRRHFPERNRIIAGLVAGVVVVEGGEKSGALITARIALDANRSVFAILGSAETPWRPGPTG